MNGNEERKKALVYLRCTSVDKSTEISMEKNLRQAIYTTAAAPTATTISSQTHRQIAENTSENKRKNKRQWQYARTVRNCYLHEI